MPQVRDVMVADVVTGEQSMTAREAAQRMIQNEVGPLPLVEGDRPVAMITDRDLTARVVAEARAPIR